MRLAGKVAAITGGARGIGKETALLFAREGATVSIWDVDAAAIQDAVNAVKEAGGQADSAIVDVTNRSQVQEAAAATAAKWGKIDILVNNAGITKDAMVYKMTDDQWDRVIAVNLTGVYNCTRAVIPFMLEKGTGCILNASSVVGLYGNIGQTNYAATKAGIIGMTRTWARELGRKGIRVNAVAPGFVVTDMTAAVPEKILAMMQEKTPLGRLGLPQDIAKAYLFLASDDAGFVNGQVLGVDGGLVV